MTSLSKKFSTWSLLELRDELVATSSLKEQKNIDVANVDKRIAELEAVINERLLGEETSESQLILG